ncbi:hypothetical protein HPP92_016903 [Vanilla planifolia]|uniref:Two-component response regulator n=1 Tax=Vanilla planifolia TaxID=51239 RepID=A0A835USI5_VANPL|nr:hypothetical protein HPP92_016903 [Vanilla planifolia]
MIVEEKRGDMARDEGHGDQFPLGMRVLAVDDDPICLKVLETLLLRCKYHVTTTNQAIKALTMLRENKDRFDLVISDVHMPDMDGFKLLELVGLEMDLPVIMLSANGETKAVMKGITHGACDYLIKPVRIEELRNIWQHVVRRRKLEHKVEDHEKIQAENSEDIQGVGLNGQLDCNGKFNRKRKDLNDEDEDDCDENAHESEDSSAQKKPRVVWSVELHRKFVAAVNQLGIDKAVPKRILDLMNVDKLTRENVASHLQKYRLYLKRLAVASQQANVAAALGGRDTSYMHMGSFNGFGSFQGLSPSAQLQGLTTFPSNGVSGRSNPNFLGLPGLASGMVHRGHSQNNVNNTMNDLSKLSHIAAPPNQQEHLLQGIPTSLELDQLQQKQKRLNEANNRLPGAFSGVTNNALIGAPNCSQLLQGHQQQTQLRGLGNQTPIAVPSIVADRLEMSTGVSASLPDLVGCNETWQNSSSLGGYSSNTLSTRKPYSNDDMAPSNFGTTFLSTGPQMNGNPLNLSSNSLLITAHDSLALRDMQCQTDSFSGNALLMPSGIDVDPKYLKFRSTGNVGQKSEEPKLQSAIDPNIGFVSLSNSKIQNQTLLDAVADGQRLHNHFYDKKFDTSLNHSSLDTPCLGHVKADKSVTDNQLSFNEDSLFGSLKMQGGFVSNNCNFDELVNAMMKSERDEIGFVDGELGSDLFPLSTCM